MRTIHASVCSQGQQCEALVTNSLGVYYSRQKEKTTFSSSIISFKSGKESVIDRFCGESIALLRSNCIRYDFIVRALGAKEMSADYGRPLDYIGTALEREGIGRYLPEIIRKERIVTSVRRLAHHQRHRHVRNAYRAELPDVSMAAPQILVIDDVYASGATTAAICVALRESAPAAAIDVFTLATVAVQ